MKSFFKKIALVLVLAMVVTMMPANLRVASAADGPQMYKTLKFYLGGDETGKYSDEPRYAKTWDKDGYDVVGQFVSSNPEVAKVNKKGLVTPLKVGTTTITATFKSTTGGEDVVRECDVTVKKNAVEAGISDKDAATLEEGLNVGESKLLKTYRKDADGVTSWKGKDVITSGARFTSSNTEVFTVTKTGGTVKAIAPGTATLSVWAVQSEGRLKNEDGTDGEYLAVTPVKEYTVKVVPAAPDVVTYDRARLTADLYELSADGRPGTIITFTLINQETGDIDTETKDVQVRLETTRGTLAFTNVTLEKGIARVLYTTPILTEEADALITATIVSAEPGAQDLINIQAAPISIKLKPVISGGVDVSGAQVTGATVVTADRITLYFNKDVDAGTFWNNSGKHFELLIKDNVPQTVTSVDYAGGHTITHDDVVKILQNGTKSLTFVLGDEKTGDTNKGVFTDNSWYVLSFIDKRYTAQVSSPNITGYVTDSILPSVLSVAPKNGKSLREIIITFSEPIPNFTVEQISIDGQPLAGIYAADNCLWGAGVENGERATIERLNGDSTRHQFKITLGKNADGKKCYFPVGMHSITISNVGDHASRTDTTNIIATQNLNFKIIANEEAPSFTVQAQSPEQYLVTFNCTEDELENFNGVMGKDSKDENTYLTLQYSKNNGNWEDVKYLGNGQFYNVINVTPNGSEVTVMLIEVQKDWTQVIAGGNYYDPSLRFRVHADNIVNAANGKNRSYDYEINDAVMKNVDYQPPQFVNEEIEEVRAGEVYKVRFTEPIQFTKNGIAAGVPLAGNITPSTGQTFNGQSSVPILTAQVVAKDLSQTVDANIIAIDRQNYELTIETTVGLTPGKEYFLYVRSVSDDIGNTSPTLRKEFKVGGRPAETFEVVGVWADTQFEPTNGVYQLDPYVNTDMVYDAVYVEFTHDFAKSGNTDTVLANTNWAINGSPLPAGSFILAYIVGDARLTGVTIVLPNGTITNIDRTVVTLSANVKDVNGNSLSGRNRWVTQYPGTITGFTVISPDYSGKIGSFPVNNPNTVLDFEIPGIKTYDSIDAAFGKVVTRAAANATAVSGSSEGLIVEEDSVTVNITPTITLDTEKMNGYSVALYGIKEDANSNYVRTLIRVVEVSEASTECSAVFGISATDWAKYMQDYENGCFEINITVKAKEAGGNLATSKYTKFEVEE